MGRTRAEYALVFASLWQALVVFFSRFRMRYVLAVTLMWSHHFSLVLVTSRHVYPFKGVTVNAVYTYRKEASSSVRCRSLNTF